MCVAEYMVNLSNSTFCVYQHSLQQMLYPDLREAGIAGADSHILQWLQDTQFSGKSVRLTSGDIFTAEVETNHSLTTSFRLTSSLEALKDGGAAVQIQATQDLISSEILEVPVMLVSSAPRPIIRVNSALQSNASFLFPQFSSGDTRSDYAMCGGRSDTAQLLAHVSDERFEVVYTDLQEPSSCYSNQPDQRRMFRSVRRKDSGCGQWCEHYIPRAGSYDIVVDRSPKECYRLALNLKDLRALQNTKIMTEGAA